MKTINVNKLSKIHGGVLDANGCFYPSPTVVGILTPDTFKKNGGVIVINDPRPKPKLPTM